ncbi:uncharacterized protein LOC132737147 [Ruditapes philippinarum]|uniref:uncharacterized protein LOC132737147 n=1 Tax=Ruditapes philippinarum TaxID=129788 RepID=UPI00295C2BF5|nr:uncharacterized protein LOC132737147 [Ruditapes philippinarum]
MYFAFVVLLLTSYINANEMDPKTLEGFQSAIYGNIMAHLDAEYQLLQPELFEHNRSMEFCKGQVETAQEACRICAGIECEGHFGDWITGGLSDMGGWFKGAGNSFVDWKGWEAMGGFFGKVGNWFQGAGNSFVGWKGFEDMSNFFSGIGNTFSSGFNSVKNGLSSFGNKISNGFSSVGNKIGNGFKKVGSGFKSVFGRRRRSVRRAMMVHKLRTVRHRYMAKRQQELDEQTRQCMQKCTECTPFLGDQTALIGEVCGDDILLEEAAMTELMSKMQALYVANGNPLQGTTPIVSKIEYEQTDLDFTDFSVGGVYVTATTPNGVIRYASKHRYLMQSPQTTADLLATELIKMWS